MATSVCLRRKKTPAAPISPYGIGKWAGDKYGLRQTVVQRGDGLDCGRTRRISILRQDCQAGSELRIVQGLN